MDSKSLIKTFSTKNHNEETSKLDKHTLPPIANEVYSPRRTIALKGILGGPAFECIPPEIIFTDIDINQAYEVTLLIRNLMPQGLRIRIFQPKSEKFRCDYEMRNEISTGIAMKAIVSFESNVLQEVHDSLEVVCNTNFKAIVPLHAYPPQASINFEPFLNFGFSRIRYTNTKSVLFSNEGIIFRFC